MTWQHDPGPAETQVMVASTGYGLATLAAAMEDNLFPPAARRILVLSNNAANPETARPLDSIEGFDQLAKRFDVVFSYNDAVAPQHPSEWMPRAVDIPLWDRHFRLLWDLADDDHLRLVVESIQVRPGAALCAILHDAEIDVYADGLMSYGPTRSAIPTLVATRISRLLHLDLVPGLRPLLLSEWDVPCEVVSGTAFRTVLAEISQHADLPTLDQPVALLLGQYLSALSILTPAEEADLHLRMLRAAFRLGHRRVIFKPHPTASVTLAEPIIVEARALGIELTVWPDPVLAETLYERLPVAFVIGCFSTAMVTAVSCYGLPTASVGTTLLLERLSPYENSNRIPVTLVDALLPTLDFGGVAGGHLSMSGDEVRPLVTAVGYAMQPKIHPELRDEAERFLTLNYPAAARYFKRRRLTVLGLPGALPPPSRWALTRSAWRKRARSARSKCRKLGRGLQARLQRPDRAH